MSSLEEFLETPGWKRFANFANTIKFINFIIFLIVIIATTLLF